MFFSCQMDWHRHERLHGFFFIVLTAHKLLFAENDDRKDTVGIWLQHEDRHLTSDIRIHSVTTISLVSVEFFWIFVLSARCSSQMVQCAALWRCESVTGSPILESRPRSHICFFFKFLFVPDRRIGTDSKRLQGFFFIVLNSSQVVVAENDE